MPVIYCYMSGCLLSHPRILQNIVGKALKFEYIPQSSCFGHVHPQCVSAKRWETFMCWLKPQWTYYCSLAAVVYSLWEWGPEKTMDLGPSLFFSFPLVLYATFVTLQRSLAEMVSQFLVISACTTVSQIYAHCEEIFWSQVLCYNSANGLQQWEFLAFSFCKWGIREIKECLQESPQCIWHRTFGPRYSDSRVNVCNH